jgi:hypothetical protein
MKNLCNSKFKKLADTLLGKLVLLLSVWYAIACHAITVTNYPSWCSVVMKPLSIISERTVKNKWWMQESYLFQIIWGELEWRHHIFDFIPLMNFSKLFVSHFWCWYFCIKQIPCVIKIIIIILILPSTVLCLINMFLYHIKYQGWVVNTPALCFGCPRLKSWPWDKLLWQVSHGFPQCLWAKTRIVP